MKKLDCARHFIAKNRLQVLVGLSLVSAPLIIQILYTIPLLEPNVTADAVLQFTGTVLGLVFAASIAYQKKKKEMQAEQEAAIRKKCVHLLHDLRVGPPETQLKSETRERLIHISSELMALDSDSSRSIHNAMKPLGQKLLNAQSSYYSALEAAKAEAFETHPVYSSEGEEGEDFIYPNPDLELARRKQKILEERLIDNSTFQSYIRNALDQLGRTF